MRNNEHKIINPEASLKDVMSALNNSKYKILFCCYEDGHLIGTITDGDVRRAFLKYESDKLNAKVISNKNPLICREDNPNKILKEANQKNIEFVPLLKDGVLIDILTSNQLINAALPPVVLMAGGLGKRLGDLTKNNPKPLVKLQKNIAIIDIILINLIKQGMSELYVTLNFEWKKIKDYLTEKYSKDISINFIIEKEKMGTAGSMFYLKDRLPENFILMNADIVTSLDFQSLIKFHRKNKNLISVVANKTSFEISKGVIEYSGSIIKSITEKPNKEYTYNAGIYAINKQCIDDIQEKYLDMPDLINEFIPTKKVGIFPLLEYWKDLGLPEDLEQAKRDLVNGLK